MLSHGTKDRTTAPEGAVVGESLTNTQEGVVTEDQLCHQLEAERRPFGTRPRHWGSSYSDTASGYFNPTFDFARFGGYGPVYSPNPAVIGGLKLYSDGSSPHTRSADVGSALVGRQSEIAHSFSRPRAWKTVGNMTQ